MATSSTTAARPKAVPLEKTLGIIKPNTVARAEEIEDIIVKKGFTIIQKRRAMLSKEQARDFYAEHEGKPFFEGLVEYMTNGPILAMVLAGTDAVSRWRQVIGPTDPRTARKEQPESIRALFSGKENPDNAVHGSDSVANAEREIKFFFPDAVFEPVLEGDIAREYLAKTVNPVLLKGLVQLCRQKPDNPVVWLADWLLANNPNKPTLQ